MVRGSSPHCARTGHPRRNLGHFGEGWATQYLERVLGWQVVERNWRCRAGEVDILAQNGRWLVMVEVRTRRWGGPELAVEAVGPRKRRQLARLVPYVQAVFGFSPPLRVDVVALDVAGRNVCQVHHIRNVPLADGPF
ncbi:MAG: YraN family protein [Alicyclobacillus sp.]|nr:YraN family protein [Alicyclobacillus sp.]